MDELVDEKILILVDIKNVRLIWTGQFVVNLNHAEQEFILFGILTTKCLFIVFGIKELKFQAIKFGNMLVN